MARIRALTSYPMNPPTVITSPASIGLKIVMDPTQIFPSDPGQGQPVYVEETKTGKGYAASWNCATCEGELDCGSYILNDRQQDWLESQADAVMKWQAANGA